MDQRDSDATNTADREIVNARVFDVPRELVWKAWTNPKHVAEWWGPNGFTNTIHEMDVRPGGVWRFTMHGPDGTDYKNKIIFSEIVKPALIVHDHVSGPKFQVTATFDEQDSKTRVTFCMLFESADAYETVKAYAAEANEQNFDRLERQLVKV